MALCGTPAPALLASSFAWRRDQVAALKIFPDGGVARLRLYGSLTDDGLATLRRRWDETGLTVIS